MKRKLLIGAFLLGSIVTANAQSDCTDPLELTEGITNIPEMTGTYYQSCFANYGADDVADAAAWYYIVAPANGVYRVNTNLQSNSGLDTRIAIYSGTCDALTCWWSGDDVYYGGATNTSNNFLTDIQFPVLEGETYYISFDNQYMDDAFDVELSFFGADCEDTSLPFTETWNPSTNYWFCWSNVDNNQDQNDFGLLTRYNFGGQTVEPDFCAAISSAENDLDDFLVSPAKSVTAGTEYQVSVTYNGINVSATNAANESFEVVAVEPTTGSYTVLGAEEGVVMTGATLGAVLAGATTGTYTYEADADGELLFGVHSTSAAGGGYLAIFEVSVEAVNGVGTNKSDAFSVYPNPANSVVNVANTKAQISSVKLTDINGRTVKSASFEGVSSAQVNISDLSAGVYMMTINSDKGSVTKKVVKN